MPNGFDSFDFGNIAKGAGKALKGVVVAARPEAGAGMIEAGEGLSQILKAAGLDLGDGAAAPAQPAEPPEPARNPVRDFDRYGLALRRVPSRPPPVDVEAEALDERAIAAQELSRLGYGEDEIAGILRGPQAEPVTLAAAAPAQRLREAEASTETATALARPAAARRVVPAAARRVKSSP